MLDLFGATHVRHSFDSIGGMDAILGAGNQLVIKLQREQQFGDTRHQASDTGWDLGRHMANAIGVDQGHSR